MDVEARRKLIEQRLKRLVESITQDLDPECEFKNFQLLSSRWVKGMSAEDYSDLLGKVISYAETLRSEAKVTARRSFYIGDEVW